MLQLPSLLREKYRPATDREIRSWSFGAVKEAHTIGAAFWGEQIGSTFEDQRVFGPLRDFVCACGKYQGERFKGMICDR